MAASDALEVSIEAATRGGATCLANVELTMWGAAVHAIIGPNGAGKSTFLRALAGLDPLRGFVRYAGKTLVPGAADLRARRVAWVPQEPSIPQGVTVADVVGLARAFRGESARTISHHVHHALERVRLDNQSERLFETLSAGQRQRAVIARALATDAPVLLLDEPFSSLDLGASLALETLVSDLAREGSLVIVVVHDLAQAARIAQTLHVLDRGRLVTSGPPRDVLTPDRLRTLWGVRARDESFTSFELAERP